MFLVPEVFSHVGGFWASYLLVRREWVGALLVGGLVKGTATLAEVWIYQSCEGTLLSVQWFAWVHGQFMRGRDWVAERLLGGRNGIARRFRALRMLVAIKLGLQKK